MMNSVLENFTYRCGGWNREVGWGSGGGGIEKG